MSSKLPIKQTVGERIRIERIRRGYSQEYMAYELNISQNAYSKVERQQSELTVKRLYAIAKILEMDVKELLPESYEGAALHQHGVSEVWQWVTGWLQTVFKQLPYRK